MLPHPEPRVPAWKPRALFVVVSIDRMSRPQAPDGRAPRAIRVLLAVVPLVLGPFACAHSRAVVEATPAESVPPRDVMSMSDQQLLASKALMVPVQGIAPARVRDTFTAPRGERTHDALDILAPRGTPVLAADGGRIFRLRTNEAGGITVYQLDTHERFVYYYAHLDRYRRGLAEGMEVRQGDVIGYVGTTGNAPPDTPHLHFQVMRFRGDGRYWDGRPIDPWPYLVRPGRER